MLNVQQELAEAQVALSNADQKLASLKVQHGGDTTTPPYGWPTRIAGPSCAASARLVTATSDPG